MYALLQQLLHPFPCLIIGLGLGLAVLLRGRRSRWCWFLFCVWLLLYVDGLPIAAYFSAGSLEWQFPRHEERPEGTRVVVVLGGGVYPARGHSDHDRLETSSLVRAVRAAELYRAGPRCPILISGGCVQPERPVSAPATLMADFLRQFGIPEEDLIVEDGSRNTEENARFSAEILRERGWDEGIVLVTSATHLPRSVAFFRHNGVKVTPVGCAYRTDACDPGLRGFWPSPGAATIHQEVLHEWLGMAWARLRGKL